MEIYLFVLREGKNIFLAQLILARPRQEAHRGHGFHTRPNRRKSYKESVIGKVMERVINKRLVWKLEVEEGVAKTQFAFRKQKSCVQTVLRMCNSVSEARNKKENTIVTVMDFESCYERIWRAGLLKKASTYGINGRLWIYIKNFIMDRKYYLKVNDYTS